MQHSTAAALREPRLPALYPLRACGLRARSSVGREVPLPRKSRCTPEAPVPAIRVTYLAAKRETQSVATKVRTALDRKGRGA